MDEQEIYEGLGLELPEAEEVAGAEDVPAVEDAPETEDAGAEAVAEELEADAEQEDKPAETHPKKGDGDTPFGRSGNVPVDAQTERDKAFREALAGKLNPFDGTPILTEADYLRMKDAERTERARADEEQLRELGLPADVLRRMVAEHPDVVAARESARVAEVQREAAQREQAIAWYDAQMKEITELEPEITSLETLAARHPEEYPKMLKAVEAGVPLAVAYKGMFFDALASKRAAAARQAGAVQAAGKGHLRPAGGGGKAAVIVPDDVRAQYRDVMPDMTEREIQAAYEKFTKEMK